MAMRRFADRPISASEFCEKPWWMVGSFFKKKAIHLGVSWTISDIEKGATKLWLELGKRFLPTHDQGPRLENFTLTFLEPQK